MHLTVGQLAQNQDFAKYLLYDIASFWEPLPVVKTQIPLGMLRHVVFRKDGCWHWTGSTRYSQYKTTRYYYPLYNGNRQTFIALSRAVHKTGRVTTEMARLTHAICG